ncbi:MAG TPA: SRPBCC family protein [Fimbriimonas sp.]|nr:SRPBCC family protein [Fimbriimonas sp.]
MIRIQVTAIYPSPIQTVFDEHRNVDLHVKSQASHRERAIGGVTSGLLNLGDEVEWEAVHFGVKQRLRAKITQMSAPDSFSDEQLSGPFKSLVHQHRFKSLDSGATEKTEIVELRAPLGPLGVIAERVFLGRYMQKLLEDKSRAMGGEVVDATVTYKD